METPSHAMPSRLGRNLGAYHGEGIDIEGVLRGCQDAARRFDWTTEWLAGPSHLQLLALRRPGVAPAARIYLSTGIHGDEPAGPLALRQLLENNRWPASCEILLCPCLNPTGFAANRRENAQGFDLNRDYRDPVTPEVRAHTAWLDRQPPFDLAFCLHEDWEAGGFYLYELNPDGRPSLAEAMVEAAARVCPIDSAPIIDGRETSAPGIIRPQLEPAERPQWPEAFYLLSYKTRLSYTLEAPSDFPLPVRVAALMAAVVAGLTAHAAPLNSKARAIRGAPGAPANGG